MQILSFLPKAFQLVSLSHSLNCLICWFECTRLIPNLYPKNSLLSINRPSHPLIGLHGQLEQNLNTQIFHFRKITSFQNSAKQLQALYSIVFLFGHLSSCKNGTKIRLRRFYLHLLSKCLSMILSDRIHTTIQGGFPHHKRQILAHIQDTHHHSYLKSCIRG